jgi:hypothetical protein
VKPADVRFHFDADILGLAKTVCALRPDCTYPGDLGAVIHKRRRRSCDIAAGTPDVDWIPVVAARGWVIITRDSIIQNHVAELNAVLDNGGRMAALSSKDAQTVWSQLEVFMARWRSIEALHDLPAPFVYTVTRTGFRQVAR